MTGGMPDLLMFSTLLLACSRADVDQVHSTKTIVSAADKSMPSDMAPMLPMMHLVSPLWKSLRALSLLARDVSPTITTGLCSRRASSRRATTSLWWAKTTTGSPACKRSSMKSAAYATLRIPASCMISDNPSNASKALGLANRASASNACSRLSVGKSKVIRLTCGSR